MRLTLKSLKFILVLVVFLGITLPNYSDAYVSVKGYYRKNGTYVAPYVRSNPNGLKYDNYGYKPSQGLYNPSYGTKDSSWDTPTYITDPNYYQGKALYDSNSTGYVQPNNPIVNSLILLESNNQSCRNAYGLNSNWDGTKTSNGLLNCGCQAGTYWNTAKTACIISNAEINNQSCRTNYGIDSKWDGTVTADGKLNCSCIVGYKFSGNPLSCTSINSGGEDTATQIIKLLDQIRMLQDKLSKLK